MAWTDDITCQFFVKSCYNWFLNEQNENWRRPEVWVQLKRLWKYKVQSKIHIFDWHMFINKLPCKKKPNKRGIFHNFIHLTCVSCFAIEKDLFHLLFSCLFATRVWESICDWSEMEHLVENSILNHVDNFFSLKSGKVVRNKKMLVWLTTRGSL